MKAQKELFSEWNQKYNNLKKKSKNCNFCRAYTGNQCLLKYKIEVLPKDLCVEDYTTRYKEFINICHCVYVRHRPLEKCLKPKTKKQMVESMKNRGII
jgi:hypothetical protein